MSSGNDASSRAAAGTAPLFAALDLGGVLLRNRTAVAPMTRVSATAEGYPTERMSKYYRGFAEGGFGLVITEGIYTDQEYSQGYLFQPGLANDPQRDAWRSIIEAVHRHGARVFAQLMHAGALSQGNPHRSETRGPSAVQPKGQQMSRFRGSGAYETPGSMSALEISAVVSGFAKAAVRAHEAGFDGIELHGANGYLLDQFLTERVNIRNDHYGGDVTRRLRLILEVVEAVRAAVGSQFVIGIRISQGKVNDFTHQWSGGEETASTVFDALGKLPIDYIHTTQFEAWQPAFGAGSSLAALARRHGGKPVVANGSLHAPAQSIGMLERGEADLISLGRGALTHTDWPSRVKRGASIDEFDPSLLSPIADLENADLRRAELIRLSGT